MDALKMLTEAEIDRGVYNLSEDEKVYFKLLISHLVRSFSDPAYSCVMVVGLHDKGTVSVLHLERKWLTSVRREFNL